MAMLLRSFSKGIVEPQHHAVQQYSMQEHTVFHHQVEIIMQIFSSIKLIPNQTRN